MHNDHDLEQWLLGLPLDETFGIDGELVFLKVNGQGAELGLILTPAATGEQIADALHSGFQSALDFDAGLALSPDGGDLLLTRWLPGIETWADAAEALEELLNQAGMWRAAMAAPDSRPADPGRRYEQRYGAHLRKTITGEDDEAA